VTRWPQGGGADYAARFAALAESGVDLHGEARFCASLVPTGARILDAGCGTGRVAVELTRRGYECVGVDVDASMLAEARRAAPDGTWIRSDLADLDLRAEGLTEPFDLVVCAGNVVPLVSAGAGARTVLRMAQQLRPGGLLVAGFGLDRAHLPRQAAVVPIDDYDQWCVAAGLSPQVRFATWDADPWNPDCGYAVSVSRAA
jgi:SAM-dependent methyltransferase